MGLNQLPLAPCCALTIFDAGRHKEITMEETTYDKPPQGLMPRSVHEYERFREVKLAMKRYYDAELEIPIEWVEEYNYLLGRQK